MSAEDAGQLRADSAADVGDYRETLQSNDAATAQVHTLSMNAPFIHTIGRQITAV